MHALKQEAEPADDGGMADMADMAEIADEAEVEEEEDADFAGVMEVAGSTAIACPRTGRAGTRHEAGGRRFTRPRSPAHGAQDNEP